MKQKCETDGKRNVATPAKHLDCCQREEGKKKKIERRSTSGCSTKKKSREHHKSFAFQNNECFFSLLLNGKKKNVCWPREEGCKPPQERQRLAGISACCCLTKAWKKKNLGSVALYHIYIFFLPSRRT